MLILEAENLPFTCRNKASVCFQSWNLYSTWLLGPSWWIHYANWLLANFPCHLIQKQLDNKVQVCGSICNMTNCQWSQPVDLDAALAILLLSLSQWIPMQAGYFSMSQPTWSWSVDPYAAGLLSPSLWDRQKGQASGGAACWLLCWT